MTRNKMLNTTFELQTSMQSAVNVMFIQMQANVGFKLFKEKAISYMVKELKQLEYSPMPGKQVFTAIDPDTLSLEQKKRALNAINLIKQKRDGLIKGRTCADDSDQCTFLSVDESVVFPTVSLEAFFRHSNSGSF